jgi:hypothetical protein
MHRDFSRKPQNHAPKETNGTQDLLKTHRTWKDGVGPMLGLMIAWFYDEPVVPVVVLNSGLTGLAVLALAQLELVHLRRWDEIAKKGSRLRAFLSAAC